MKTPTARGYLAAILTVGWLAWSAESNLAKADTFILNTNQSSLTISGDISGYPFTQQGNGSLFTYYSGTIQATQTGGTIQFPGGSSITALDSGTWQPLAGGSAGSAPANYGASANVFYIFAYVSVKAALRSILLDVTSPAIPVTGGQLIATNLTFLFPTNATSSLDYLPAAYVGGGSTALTGDATNNVTTNATLVTVGSQQTLTIPVNTQFLFPIAGGSFLATVNLAGQIVAVRTIPTTLTIAAITVNTQVVTLHWQSPAGQLFQVQSTTNLHSWQTNASNVTSATTTYSWSGTNPAPNGFYRLAH